MSMRDAILRRATMLKEDLADNLGNLATARMLLWKAEFAKKHPRLHGRVSFGMGTEVLIVGTKCVHHPGDEYIQSRRASKGVRGRVGNHGRVSLGLPR